MTVSSQTAVGNCTVEMEERAVLGQSTEGALVSVDRLLVLVHYLL